ncbi:MAG: FHA domain-containing protein [Pseudomonadota bacterium]
MPALTIQERGKDRTWVHECAEDVITIGRLDENVVQLRSDGVSRQHAKIAVEGANFFLIDSMSGNGTFLNGMRIQPNDKNLLRPGDLITIDTFDIRFHEGADAMKSAFDEEVTDSDILEVKLLKKVLNALDKEMVPSLEVLNGAAEGKKIFFTDEMGELTIGRDPDCDFSINEYVISRKHAKVMKRWGGIAIRDLESKNGTFVNNRRIVEEFLHDGDRIALGTIVIMFRNPQEINLTALEEVSPRYRPAPVKPQEIPGLEEEVPPEAAPAQEEERAEEGTPPAGEGKSSTLEEWDELEKSLSGRTAYPTPQARIEAIKKLTPIEIGMIGLGAVVLIFALITIVNLIAS